MTKNKLYSLSFIFLTFIFFSCASTSKQNWDCPDEIDLLTQDQLCPSPVVFEEIEAGIASASCTIPELDVTWHCVRIDLSSPQLIINIKTSDKPFKLKTFARKNRTAIAINTTPFDSRKLIGITKVCEKEISPPVERYCALGFYYKNGVRKAEIIPHQIAEAINKYDFCIGGFFQILQNDQIDFNFAKTRRSRTGCGINSKTNQLYLMTVTSNTGFKDNKGLTYQECAILFKTLGCDQAMQFDGGHSTGLCIYNNQTAKPFMQRKILAAIGFITN